MNTAIALPMQVKNLQAGNLLLAWSIQNIMLSSSVAFAWLLGFSVLWFAFFWVRQFKLRRQLGFGAVRSLTQIWTAAREQRFNSYVLMLPFICCALILLGYLPFGIKGLAVSLSSCLLLCVLVMLSERFPLAAYA